MNRRAFLCGLTLGTLSSPLVAEGQQAGKVWRIGHLTLNPRPEPGFNPIFDAFVQRLRELGYVEGRNISIEWRSSEGRVDRLPDLAAELVRLNVDVIVEPLDKGIKDG